MMIWLASFTMPESVSSISGSFGVRLCSSSSSSSPLPSGSRIGPVGVFAVLRRSP